MPTLEPLELTSGLKCLLWFEVVLYGGLGVFETFDDFFKFATWNKPFVQDNAYSRLMFKGMVKMHGAICFMLAFVAVNALIEGEMSAFDFELNFVVLGLIMAAVWGTMMPFRLWLTVALFKPETYITIALWLSYTDMVRPGILYLNAALNLWGLFVRASAGFVPQPTYFEPFTYETLRKDILAADPETAEKLDKVTGYKGDELISE